MLQIPKGREREGWVIRPVFALERSRKFLCFPFFPFSYSLSFCLSLSVFIPSGLHSFTPFFFSLLLLWFLNSQWQGSKFWFSDHRGMKQMSVTAPWQWNKYCSASLVPDNLTCFLFQTCWNEKRKRRQINTMALKLICMGIREIIFVHIDPIPAC